MACAKIKNSVHSVESKRVEVILLQPVERVLNKEPSYVVAVLSVVIDRVAPGSSVTICEVRSVCAKVIALRTEMVVNDIERDRQTVNVGSIDETLQ